MHTDHYDCHTRTLISNGAHDQNGAHDEPADEDLLAQIQEQDEEALAALYKRHTALLRTIVARVVNNDHDVDDLIQEVFLEIWRQAAHYDPAKGKVLGWIVTLARRRAIDKLRRRQAYYRAGERLRAELGPKPTTSDCVEDEVMASDARDILQRVVTNLPDAQRDAIQLAFYRGLSQREIAAQTGIPLGTIKTRIELAVSKIRSAILALGGENAWRRNSSTNSRTTSRSRSRRHAEMPRRLSFA